MNLAGLKTLLLPLYHKIPEEIRVGKCYKEQRRFLDKSRGWSIEQIQAWQLDRIKTLLKKVYDETHYYRELFDRIGLSDNVIKSLEEFEKIPFLTKEIAQLNCEKLVPYTWDRKRLEYGSTSGSTGIPLGLYSVKRHTAYVEKAFVHSIWIEFGFKTNRRHVVIRGYTLKDKSIERRGNNLILSSYHLTEQNIPGYIDAIEQFRPEYIQAYPSSITRICQFMKEKSVPRFSSVKLLFCSSENLLSFQRELISEVLRVPICNLYGNTEYTAIGSNFPHCDNLHFYPEYGFVELFKENGQKCSKLGELGEIVSTGFINPAFPMIRYRTGDIGQYVGQQCGCGWKYLTIKKVEGREQEFILTGDGRKISIAALNMHSDLFVNVSKFQFYQKTPGTVILRLVPTRGFSSADERKIFSQFMEKFGNGVDLKISIVDDIPLSGRGKFKFLIQELNLNLS
jgi:phenylacetate-CoA ligase